MGKNACKKKEFENSGNPKFQCKKCGAKVNMEEKVCKPEKLK